MHDKASHQQSTCTWLRIRVKWDGSHGFRRSKKAFMRLGHDRGDQGWIGSSGRSKEKARYCYERNDIGKVRKQEDSLVIGWWTQVKVEVLYGKVTSIKLGKRIGTRLLRDLKVMSHPKFLLLVQMTRRKKGRRKEEKKKKIKWCQWIYTCNYICMCLCPLFYEKINYYML